MIPKLIRTTFFCALALTLAPAANAQVGKNPQVKAAFGDVCAKAAQSTVRVYGDGKELALGVVVDKDGWILTKHSALKGKLTCKLPSGKSVDAEMHGHDVPYDLALLKVEADDLTPAEFCDSKCAKVGYWVCSPDPKNNFCSIGVVSVETREVKNAKQQLSGPPKAWLGVQFDTEYAGVKVQQVVNDSPAQKGGIKVNDVVLKVNGETFQSYEEFAGFVGKFEVGTMLDVKVERDEMEVDLKVTMGKRPDGKAPGINPQEKFGSKLSDRRGGFPHILTHDSVIRPEDCGGPLVDTKGKVVGINIARAGRTESYAIPAERVQPLIDRLKKKPEEK